MVRHCEGLPSSVPVGGRRELGSAWYSNTREHAARTGEPNVLVDKVEWADLPRIRRLQHTCMSYQPQASRRMATKPHRCYAAHRPVLANHLGGALQCRLALSQEHRGVGPATESLEQVRWRLVARRQPGLGGAEAGGEVERGLSDVAWRERSVARAGYSQGPPHPPAKTLMPLALANWMRRWPRPPQPMTASH